MNTQLSTIEEYQYINYDDMMKYSIYLYMKFKYRNNVVQTIVFDKHNSDVEVL